MERHLAPKHKMQRLCHIHGHSKFQLLVLKPAGRQMHSKRTRWRQLRNRSEVLICHSGGRYYQGFLF